MITHSDDGGDGDDFKSICLSICYLDDDNVDSDDSGGATTISY